MAKTYKLLIKTHTQDTSGNLTLSHYDRTLLNEVRPAKKENIGLLIRTKIGWKKNTYFQVGQRKPLKVAAIISQMNKRSVEMAASSNGDFCGTWRQAAWRDMSNKSPRNACPP